MKFDIFDFLHIIKPGKLMLIPKRRRFEECFLEVASAQGRKEMAGL
jgi:hypothetical protein